MWDALDTFGRWYVEYGYPVLFAGVFLENAGLPVPGETAVLVAGFLASPAGGECFSLEGVMAVTFVAAILGDNLGYGLGRRLARPRLQQERGFLFLTPARFRRVEAYFEHYGAWTVLVARFITGLRVVCALAAGAAGMRWLRFLLANAAGALIWAVTITLLGYFFGQSWSALSRWMHWGAWVVLACVLLAFIVWRWLTYSK